MTKRLILAGGGHAHLAVLKALARSPLRGVEVLLVTPQVRLSYSGMLPGWLAGHYERREIEIDLQPLAQRANVACVEATVDAMDADRRCVVLSNGRHVEFDVLSLDVGSEIDTSWLETLGERLLPLRPLPEFMNRWPAVLSAARARQGFHVAVAGAGAAAFEVALAVRYALVRQCRDSRVCLVGPRDRFLHGHSAGTRRRGEAWLRRAGVAVHDGRAVSYRHGLLTADGAQFPADAVIAATGAAAPSWLKLSRVQLDRDGFVAVDATHRSVSHPHVFAAGDVCARQDRSFSRSGVHAVRAGPVLAHNLCAALQDRPLRRYRPRSRSLYLMACGERSAVVSWGALSADGAWAWRWKDRIDRRFVQRHSVLPDERRLSEMQA